MLLGLGIRGIDIIVNGIEMGDRTAPSDSVVDRAPSVKAPGREDLVRGHESIWHRRQGMDNDFTLQK